MIRRSIIIAAVLGGIIASGPAHAAAVSVTLNVSFAEPFTDALTYATCSVAVPEGADGIDVLSQAQREGCIESYEATSFPEGTFLDCIDGICGTPATYWRMTENGVSTSYGVDGFQAQAGDVLGFSYTTWIPCVADESFC